MLLDKQHGHMLFVQVAQFKARLHLRKANM